MKKIVALVLLTVFSFHIAGYTALFFIEKHQLKKEMIRRIKSGDFKADLIAVTIDSSNKHLIHWHEKNEFSYKKNMYDVVTVKKPTKQTTVYYCINDKKEAELLKKLRQHLTGNKKQHKPNQYKTALKFFVSNNEKPVKKNLTNELQKKLFYFSFNAYQPLAQDVKSPPPKLVLHTL